MSAYWFVVGEDSLKADGVVVSAEDWTPDRDTHALNIVVSRDVAPNELIKTKILERPWARRFIGVSLNVGVNVTNGSLRDLLTRIGSVTHIDVGRKSAHVPDEVYLNLSDDAVIDFVDGKTLLRLLQDDKFRDRMRGNVEVIVREPTTLRPLAFWLAQSSFWVVKVYTTAHVMAESGLHPRRLNAWLSRHTMRGSIAYVVGRDEFRGAPTSSLQAAFMLAQGSASSVPGGPGVPHVPTEAALRIMEFLGTL